jgi:predicted phosphate transport protein (TIGR00153 family)
VKRVRLIPRDEKFYVLFADLAKRLTASARLLGQLFAEPDRLEQLVAEIKAVEHEADTITHEVNLRIDRSFVTPLDREDIHLLASRLDNVVDLIDGTARRAQMFRVREMRPQARQLAEVVSKAADCIAVAVDGMKQPRLVSQQARLIKQLEEEGDSIYQEAVGALFTPANGMAPDPLEVMKWKELFDKLEDALDECEDVANVLESISIKNS